MTREPPLLAVQEDKTVVKDWGANLENCCCAGPDINKRLAMLPTESPT